MSDSTFGRSGGHGSGWGNSGARRLLERLLWEKPERIGGGDTADGWWSAFLWQRTGSEEVCLEVRQQHLPSEWFPLRSAAVVPTGGERLEGWCMSFLQRAQAAQVDRERPVSAALQSWAAKYAALYEYLAAEKYPDGTDRETSMICLFVEDGRVKACLQDRDQGRSLWTSAETPIEALEALERALRAPVQDWRQARGAGPKKKGSK